MMPPDRSDQITNDNEPAIRRARLEDQPAIERVFCEDTLAGDLDLRALGCLVQTYLDHPESRLWVAGIPDAEVVGIVGVWHADDHIAELRGLRVMSSHRKRGIGRRLVQTALAHCRDRAYLKVTLDTDVNRSAAIALFQDFGFELARTREVDGKRLHDFYLNLYRDVTE